MENIHTYAKITKDETHPWYYVLTYKQTEYSNELIDVKQIPFVFQSIDVAKDFVSVLPDKIEEFEVKDYDCDICHLCYKSYKTYKLTIGNIIAYIRWEDTTYKTTDFFGTRKHIKTTNNLVKDFVYGVNNSVGSYGNLYGDHSSYMLSEILAYVKAKEDAKKKNQEEYTFELVKQ